MSASATSSSLPTAQCPLLAWHGLSLALPEDCGPAKLEGDGAKGAVLIADLKSPRIGLRWTTLSKRADPAKFVRGAMLNEIGRLATDEAIAHDASDAFTQGLLYTEKDPPGRDVFVGFSKATRRIVELVLHVRATGDADSRHRERELPLNTLADEVLPTLRDDASRTHWSIFDLSVTLPETGWTLTKQRLNAGDLTLEFTKRRQTLIVRQIGPARLALKRQEAKQWVTIHGLLWKQMYRSSGQTEPIASPVPQVAGTPETCASGVASSPEHRSRSTATCGADGTPVATAKLVRRRRFFFARWAPPVRHIAMHHDEARDRLVLIDADDASLIEKILPTVGRREAA